MVRLALFAVAVLFSLASAASAQSLEDRVKALENRLGSSSGSGDRSVPSNQFNPAMGLSLDMVLRDQNGKGDFDFRSGELNIEAPVDPYLKAWAMINATPDEVEIEEGAVQTTSLPHGLTLRGGRLFSAIGRLAHVHDHELPFVGRPTSLVTFIGDEARADGLEFSWLVPASFYTNLTLGAYNRIGSENNRRNDDARPWDEFTYLARLHSAFEAGDDHTLDVGVNTAWTPKRRMVEDVGVTGSANPAIQTAKDTWRTLSGIDLTYRWQPAAGGLYKGLTWGTEAYSNNERRFNESTNLPNARTVAYGGYSYLQFKLGRQWRPGAMVDLAQDLDSPDGRVTKTYLGFLTYDVTEFQKVRLQYARRSVPGRSTTESTTSLQWAVIIGHHVHGFRDR